MTASLVEVVGFWESGETGGRGFRRDVALRRGQQFEAASIRRVAEQDLGCAPGLLQ